MIELISVLNSAGPSLFRIATGVSLAFVLGVFFGYLRYLLPEKIRNNHLFSFVLEAPRYPPPIAWIPFVILLVGIGELSAIIIVMIGAFFPVFTNAYLGMCGTPRAIVATARSMELTKMVFFKDILFRSALPQIIAGLRIALGMGWMSVIAAEMIGAESGLGYALQLYRTNMQYESMAFTMIIVAMFGYLLSLFMRIIEKRALAWADVKSH